MAGFEWLRQRLGDHDPLAGAGLSAGDRRSI
jgi:hypothetical protein